MIIYRDRDSDTICAISTPHGVGGISIIRISGPRSLDFISKSCAFIKDPKSHTIYYGYFKTHSNDIIDEVMVSYFQKGRSFTGEESFEISCHGNPIICQQILSELISYGARIADRGEFTYRAFINKRIDLVQAESVLSLIESQSPMASKMALRQLDGELSNKLLSFEDKIIWLLAHIESSIDFSTEGLDTLNINDILRITDDIIAEIDVMIKSFKRGRIVRDGVHVALIGAPNVGKSSLLNLFVEDECAIVTDIAGTTRDVIKSDIQFNGMKFTFLDTAGLRTNAVDLVEEIGIKKTKEVLQSSDLVLFVLDSSRPISDEEVVLLSKLPSEKIFILHNKSDLFLSGAGKKEYFSAFINIDFFHEKKFHNKDLSFDTCFFISAQDLETREKVFSEIIYRLNLNLTDNATVISSSRHFDNLLRAQSALRGAQNNIKNGIGAEILSLDYKDALLCIQEVLGKHFDDQILDRVFKEFCIGK